MQIYGKFQLIPSYKRIVWVGSVMTPVLRVPAWDVFLLNNFHPTHTCVNSWCHVLSNILFLFASNVREDEPPILIPFGLQLAVRIQR